MQSENPCWLCQRWALLWFTRSTIRLSLAGRCVFEFERAMGMILSYFKINLPVRVLPFWIFFIQDGYIRYLVCRNDMWTCPIISVLYQRVRLRQAKTRTKFLGSGEDEYFSVWRKSGVRLTFTVWPTKDDRWGSTSYIDLVKINAQVLRLHEPSYPGT